MLSSAVIEITVAGVGAFVWLSLLASVIVGDARVGLGVLKPPDAVAVIVFGGVAYGLGAIVDRLADTAYKAAGGTGAGRRLFFALAGNRPPLSDDEVDLMRARLMEEETPRTKFLEYQRSRIRIARAFVLNLVCLLPTGIVFLASRTDAGWLRIVVVAIAILLGIWASAFATERIRRAYEGRLKDVYAQWCEAHPERAGNRAVRKCRRVAAVCYRKHDGHVEFLLVRTKGGKYWTFPKGHVEKSDPDPPSAAAREAREEAGVVGRVSDEVLALYRYPPSGGDDTCRWIDVEAYLLEVGSIVESHEGRDQRWFTPEETIEALGAGRAQRFRAEHERLVTIALERLDERLDERPDEPA
jgi:8-oxo-dGTP pyrophosphatase MutT (NUDIX family)